MLAAADYAQGKRDSPPPELALYFECQLWGTLPQGSSLAEIPLGLRARTLAAVNVYHALRQYKQVGAWTNDEAKTRWYSENTQVLELIEWIEDLRDGDSEQRN